MIEHRKLDESIESRSCSISSSIFTGMVEGDTCSIMMLIVTKLSRELVPLSNISVKRGSSMDVGVDPEEAGGGSESAIRHAARRTSPARSWAVLWELSIFVEMISAIDSPGRIAGASLAWTISLIASASGRSFAQTRVALSWRNSTTRKDRSSRWQSSG